MRTVFVAACLLALALPAFAASLLQVTLPDTVTVAERTLVLNGMGVRTKPFAKVYVAGLYLERKSADADAIVQTESAKRIVLQVVRTEVTREEMRQAFNEALHANAPEQAAALRAETDRFLRVLETMQAKQQMAITYVPAIGTTVTIRGKDKLVVPGPAFGQLVFSMWLGPNPPNAELKNGLLGKGASK